MLLYIPLFFLLYMCNKNILTKQSARRKTFQPSPVSINPLKGSIRKKNNHYPVTCRQNRANVIIIFKKNIIKEKEILNCLAAFFNLLQK